MIKLDNNRMVPNAAYHFNLYTPPPDKAFIDEAKSQMDACRNKMMRIFRSSIFLSASGTVILLWLVWRYGVGSDMAGSQLLVAGGVFSLGVYVSSAFGIPLVWIGARGNKAVKYFRLMVCFTVCYAICLFLTLIKAIRVNVAQNYSVGWDDLFSVLIIMTFGVILVCFNYLYSWIDKELKKIRLQAVSLEGISVQEFFEIKRLAGNYPVIDIYLARMNRLSPSRYPVRVEYEMMKGAVANSP